MILGQKNNSGNYILLQILFLGSLLICSNCLKAQGISVASGTSFVMKGTINLVINDGHFYNNGSFTPDVSTVKFTGSILNSNSIVSSNSGLSFNNLVINRAAFGVQLNTPISISGILNLVSDSLFLNGNSINLGASGSITGESASTSITGKTGGAIIASVTLNSPTNYNPGNIGIEITSPANLGLTTITRGQTQQVSPGGGKSIYRYFDIQPTNNTGLSASLKFFYLDEELAGINKAELNQYSSLDGGNTWNLLGNDMSNQINNWVLKSAINTFGRITLASNVKNALPVKFIYFKAQTQKEENVLQWSTSSEIKNSYFEITKSFDGTTFNSIGKVKSSNENTNLQKFYSFTDKNPFPGINYYRLKQIDIDNIFAYSSIIYLNNNNQNFATQIYPNPTSGSIKIFVYSIKDKNTDIQIHNQIGQLIQNKNVHLFKGVNFFDLDLSSLISGIYYLHFRDLGTTINKIIKF